MSHRVLGLFSLLTILLLTGCASFPKQELSNIQNMPDVSRFKGKPSVYVDFSFYRGSPAAPDAVEIKQFKDKFSEKINKIVSDTSLFSSVTLDEFKKDNTDYTISLHLYNHGEVGGAMVSGFLTGFTFGIIPGVATDDYTLIAKVTDKKNKVIASTKNKDSIDTWLGIWFIPAMDNTPEKAIVATLETMIRNALNTIVKEEKIKYSIESNIQYPYNS